MEAITTVSLLNESFFDLITKLQTFSNKLSIQTIIISHTLICELHGYLFQNYQNIVNLNLSNCYIFRFEKYVFANLRQLKSINLSYNEIHFIDEQLFITNQQLETINLKKNSLKCINKLVFLSLENLKVLDFSYNLISVLGEKFLNCPHLETLYLNNNVVQEIVQMAFDELSNLTYLTLNENEITTLDQYFCRKLENLQYLNLNDNRITKLKNSSFWNCKEMRGIYLRNNNITQVIDEYMFSRNWKLTEIDLSGNDINGIERKSFAYCPLLHYLNVIVCDYFKVTSIQDLTSLRHFEVYYKVKKYPSIPSTFWNVFLTKTALVTLKLTFQKLHTIKLCDFSYLVNLEYLHMECVEPNENFRYIRLNTCFSNMRKLKTLSLIKLNNYIVSHYFVKPQKIRSLSLIGMKNDLFHDLFYRLRQLRYLNVSFSEVVKFYSHAFKYLTYLEHLVFEHSKLTFIDSFFVTFNYELRILNCTNCRIESIEDFSFKNLRNLETLDLRHNFLKQFTDNTFAGLDKQKCNILL